MSAPTEERVTETALAALYARYAADERLAGARVHANRLVPGVGSLSPVAVFVGEAPGAEEDHLGEPFVGRSGRLLDELLESVGIDRRASCYTTNIVKYRPMHNADPTWGELYASLPYLLEEIEMLDPPLVVALGRIPARELCPGLPRITECHGQPQRYGDARVLLPMVHPAYAVRGHRVVLAHDVTVLAELLRSP